MRSLKRIEDHIGRLRRFAEDNGVALSFDTTGKGHFRVTLSRNGASTFIVVPGSCSDKVRGPLRALTDGKRKMREQGWIE